MGLWSRFAERMIAVAREEAGKKAAPPPPEPAPEGKAGVGKPRSQAFYTISGRPHVRIPWGDEARFTDKQLTACPGCRARPGELHDPGCGQEQCPSCGGAAFHCGCRYGE